jgi:hypothetical protein
MPEKEKKDQKDIKSRHRDLKPRQDAKGGGGGVGGNGGLHPTASRPQGGGAYPNR